MRVDFCRFSATAPHYSTNQLRGSPCGGSGDSSRPTAVGNAGQDADYLDGESFSHGIRSRGKRREKGSGKFWPSSEVLLIQVGRQCGRFFMDRMPTLQSPTKFPVFVRNDFAPLAICSGHQGQSIELAPRAVCLTAGLRGKSSWLPLLTKHPLSPLFPSRSPSLAGMRAFRHAPPWTRAAGTFSALLVFLAVLLFSGLSQPAVGVTVRTFVSWATSTTLFQKLMVLLPIPQFTEADIPFFFFQLS